MCIPNKRGGNEPNTGTEGSMRGGGDEIRWNKKACLDRRKNEVPASPSSSVVIQRTSSLSSFSLSFSLLFLFSPPSTCSRKLIFQRTKWPTLILVTNLKSVGAKSPFKDHRDFTMRERTGEEFKGGKKKTDGEWLKDQSDWDTHTKREGERIRGLDNVEGRFKFPFPSIQPSSDVSVSRGGTFPSLVGREIIFLHRFTFNQAGKKFGEEFFAKRDVRPFVLRRTLHRGRNGSRVF